MKNLKAFKNKLNKKDISTEFVSPDEWISTGNMALNFYMTGDFSRGIPNRRSVMYWGPKGSGKSYLASLAAKNAQEKGYHVIYVDTERAAEEGFMEKVGLDLSEDKFTPVPVASIEDATEVMSQLFQSLDPDEKVFVAIDSLSMLLSEKEITDFDKGDSKGDMGQQAKKLKLFMKNINNKVANFDMFLVITGHAYANQDLLNGKGTHIFSGGEGVEYIPSISVFVNRLKLKEGKEIKGIRIKAEINKTRFTQAFQKLELNVPYDTGIDPYDGLLDLACDAELVDNSTKGWYKINVDGEEVKFRAKDFNQYVNKVFDFDEQEEIVEHENIDK